MLAPRKLVNFGPQDALYVAGLSEFDDSGVMMWGSGDTEQEAFENLRRTAARIVAAIRNPPDLSAVIAAAHAVKDRIESCRLVAGTGDGGDQVIDNFIENGYTLLDFSGYEGYHSLYNSESDDWVLLPTDGALHNYAKLALEMRARGGAILSREDVEWALLCGRSVTPEQMLAYPDLVARYGLDFA